MEKVRFAVLGGSGLYDLPGLTQVQPVDINTPFGHTSDQIMVGKLGESLIAFLPRHGRGHLYNPTKLPVQANIWALKSIGVEQIISISAVGSLREDYAPRHIVVPDQLFDHTKRRDSTFFVEPGLVAHIGFAEPFCPKLARLCADHAESAGATVHRKGTYICMEGPAFSTKGESNVYRSWGMDIIGMTAIPEAKLAREAEICYTSVACVTDYDVWHESEEKVTVDMIIANLNANINTVKTMLTTLIPVLGALHDDCECRHGLAGAIMTAPEKIPAILRRKYSLLIEKYIKDE